MISVRTVSVRFGGAIAVIFLAAFHTHTQQVTRVGLEEMLREGAGFTQADLDRVDAGEVVVVPHSGSDRQVVSVSGIAKIKGSPEISLEQFRSSLSQRGNKAKTSGGPFSVPPTIADVASMELSDKDLADLRECRIGECNINLNERAIERFRKEVDWSGAEHRRQAELLMREVLTGYAADYLSGGDKALGRFDSRKGAPALAAVHKEILEEARFVEGLAPDLFTHLANFPKSRRPEIEDELGWSTVEFGLKPMVVLTHSAIFSSPEGTVYAIAAKQFYANHYLDSSLAVTFLLRAAGENGPETYLLFTDRSRSNTLGGMFGGVARGLVETEAVNRVEKMLDTAHLNILADEYRRKNPEIAAEAEASDSYMGIFMRPWVQVMIIAVAGAFAAALYFRLRK